VVAIVADRLAVSGQTGKKLKAKSKPEILKHGGNGGKNRRKDLRKSVGCEARSTAPQSRRNITKPARPYNPLIPSDLSSGFSSVSSVFQDFWF
jgi:hypothetical protein